MTKILTITKKNIRNNYYIYLISFWYAFIFSRVALVGDDVYNTTSIFQKNNQTLVGTLYDQYLHWSSRVLINFVMFVVESGSKHNRIIFGLLTGIIVFILIKTLSKILNKKNDFYLEICIISLICIYPFNILNSAGWVATVTTYIWPLAFAVVSILPLSKIIDGNPLTITEKIVYSLSIVYAANNEQLMITLLVVYTIGLIYVSRLNKLNYYLIIQYCLLLLSVIFFVTTPGNAARSTSEIMKWFPSFGSFNILDKLQLGFTSTMYQIIFSPDYLIIVTFTIIALAVTLKNQDILSKIIGVLPLILVLTLGPILAQLPLNFKESLQQNGLINGLIDANNFDNKTIILTYLLLCLILLFVILDIILSTEGIERLFALGLLVGGGLSRISLGFSPTIWASEERTFGVLYGCLLLINIIILRSLFRQSRKSELKINITVILVVFAAINNVLLSTQIFSGK